MPGLLGRVTLSHTHTQKNQKQSFPSSSTTPETMQQNVLWSDEIVVDKYIMTGNWTQVRNQNHRQL